MKLILSGLGPETDPGQLSERMSRFGPVLGLEPVLEGDPDRPWFIVDLDIPPTAATAVARRIDGISFNGRFLHATVMLPMGCDSSSPTASSRSTCCGPPPRQVPTPSGGVLQPLRSLQGRPS